MLPGSHLCMLSLFFRKVTRFGVCWREPRPRLFVGHCHKGFSLVSLRVLMGLLRLCTLIDNWHLYYEAIRSLNASEIFLFQFVARACGCEMSQCSLRRMTSLFLSLSKMRFDFLDVTVGIWAVASISYTLLCLLFCLFFPSTPLSEVMNMKSETACVAASSLGSAVIPKYKRHSPRLHRLIPLFTTCISRADFSEPLLIWWLHFFFFVESHSIGSRKSLLDYLTFSPIRLIWISNSAGTCTKAPAEAALGVHWAYYTCTTQLIIVVSL